MGQTMHQHQGVADNIHEIQKQKQLVRETYHCRMIIYIWKKFSPCLKRYSLTTDNFEINDEGFWHVKNYNQTLEIDLMSWEILLRSIGISFFKNKPISEPAIIFLNALKNGKSFSLLQKCFIISNDYERIGFLTVIYNHFHFNIRSTNRIKLQGD